MLGTGNAGLIILDEAARLPPGLVKGVITPIFTMKYNRLLAISTLVEGDNNFFNRMLHLTYPGTSDKLFSTVEMSLVCDDCAAKSLHKHCKHMECMMPGWKSTEKQAISELMYGDADGDLYARECLGVLSNSDSKIFNMRWISALNRQVPWMNTAHHLAPSQLYMCVDPNAGGPSHMAIMTIAQIMGAYVVSEKVSM